MKKSREIKKETAKILARLKECERLEKEAEIEEKNIIEDTSIKIKELCEDNNLFCGVVLGPKEIGEIVQLMIDSKGSVKVGFNLYFLENEGE